MTKKIPFTDEELEILARKFKILSEPTRLKILRAIYKKEKNVTDIIKMTDLLQANVSKQLKILVKEGIVSARQDGLKRFYKIIDPTVLSICKKVCKDLKKMNLSSKSS